MTMSLPNGHSSGKVRSAPKAKAKAKANTKAKVKTSCFFEVDKTLTMPKVFVERVKKEGSLDEYEVAGDKLAKIELDAAWALAEFSRVAHFNQIDRQLGTNRPFLRWSSRRRRSVRYNVEESQVKQSMKSVFEDKSEPSSLSQSDKKHNIAPRVDNGNASLLESSQFLNGKIRLEKDLSQVVEKDGQENTLTAESSKDSFRLDSRAESPSSPLPVFQLDSQGISIIKDPEHSTFQRLQRMNSSTESCRLVKVKVEDRASPVKLAVRKRPKLAKSSVLLLTMKTDETISEFPLVDYFPQQVAQTQFSNVTQLDATNMGCSDIRSVKGAGGVKKETQLAIGTMKPTISEMEKEIRRLKRVQANRESARKTIRKRQVLCEELSQKAANLSSENENLKQKKEEIYRDMIILRERNAQLRLELAKHLGSEENDSFPSLIGSGDICEIDKSINKSEMVPWLPQLSCPSGVVQASNTLESSSQHCYGMTKTVPEQPTRASTSSQTTLRCEEGSRDLLESPPLPPPPPPCLLPPHHTGKYGTAAAIAAAEARRRRKELTRMKFFHLRSFRLPV